MYVWSMHVHHPNRAATWEDRIPKLDKPTAMPARAFQPESMSPAPNPTLSHLNGPHMIIALQGRSDKADMITYLSIYLDAISIRAG